ncbi:MAG: COG3014 family protein [Marinifilaceae bacterium]
MKASFPIIILCTLLLSGCATWHQRTLQFDSAINSGQYELAEKVLKGDKKQQKGKNRILYLLNLGYVEFMMGKNTESNAVFTEAEQLIEQQVRQPAAEIAALVTNPEVRPYRPEDFEVIMLNVYKTLNYLALNDFEGALVEVRRINMRLKQLNDKYPDHKSRYQQDAFAHLLMGLIYDATKDYNNAFIAYRNAYNIYEGDYAKQYGLTAPQQLKEDMVRTAKLSGLYDEADQYAQQFKLNINTISSLSANLVFLWMNGSAPYKAEWGINFAMDPQKNGMVVFNNKEYGLSFPFFIGMGGDESSLANVQVVRAAFPKYVERKPSISNASIKYNNQTYPLQMVENINAIAFKSLHDRMVREFSTSLLRVATKQGLKQLAGKQNEWLGFAVGLANAMTEKSDTRNWQTLPYSISYSRIPLQTSGSSISFIPYSGGGLNTFQIPYRADITQFKVYTTH